MISCNDIREALALQPTSDDQAIKSHLADCEECTRYRRKHQALDVVLRAEMSWEVPAALSAQLLALAANPAAALETPLAPVSARPYRAPIAERPRGWFVATVYALTGVVIVLSLLVAWQVIGALTAQIEIGPVLTQLLALPSQALAYLNQKLPQSRYAIDFFLRVRVQLMWLLLVAVLWAALDKMNLQFNFRGRQITL
ncbi:MAG TPA: anti-sigma factor [Kouleothrix sp.]|uniref:anti-sigma factor n=1 Tax=Kouleothrix sp. TaxID=2779161 RepID=UPI002D17FBB8|nr:anti-sigma factor [Kouleothrix sp.]HRC77410.1 anti-sigma factor [Kouleothrix sp.]